MDPEDVQISEIQAFLGIPEILGLLAGTDMHFESEVSGCKGDRKLVFIGDHFVVRNYYKGYSQDTDSYSRKYQLQNSHGLCMVFAAMIFRRDDFNLKPGEFFGNTRKALLWARRRLINQTSVPRQDIYRFKLSGSTFELSIHCACQQLKKMAKDARFVRSIAYQEYIDPNFNDN